MKLRTFRAAAILGFSRRIFSLPSVHLGFVESAWIVHAVGDDGLVVAVWLTEDADKSREYLPKISQYFKGDIVGCSCRTTGWS